MVRARHHDQLVGAVAAGRPARGSRRRRRRRPARPVRTAAACVTASRYDVSSSDCSGKPSTNSARTRASAAPTRDAITEPNEKPPSTCGRPGKRRAISSSAARTSSCSPRPSSCVPSERPTPRKLKRSTASPWCCSALAARNTTLKCMMPPCSGCAWQTTAAPTGSPSGLMRMDSSRPAGPARSKDSLCATRGLSRGRHCLKATPSFITNTGASTVRMLSSGLPATAITSPA